MALLSCRWCASIVAAELQLGSDSGEYFSSLLVLHARPQEKLTLTSLRDLPQVLDDESVAMAGSFPAGSEQLEMVFKSTFDILASCGGELVFKRWDEKKVNSKARFF